MPYSINKRLLGLEGDLHVNVRVVPKMPVGVHRDLDAAVAHEGLKAFGLHIHFYPKAGRDMAQGVGMEFRLDAFLLFMLAA